MVTKITTLTSVGSKESSSGTTGRVVLQPIKGSVERTPVAVELDLTREDGVLILGDLRRAAELHFNDSEFEVAHRLWTVLIDVAGRLNFDALLARSIAMADGALLELRSAAKEQRMKAGEADGRRGASYDYVSLAADCATGMTQRETAARWGCSPATVSRAVRYVNQRDEAMASASGLGREIHEGISVDELAERHGIEPKIMRWIVSDFWDRRT